MEHVRARFPALGRPAIFLDGPGGSQVPESVIEAMAAYLRRGTASNAVGSLTGAPRICAAVAAL